MKKFLVLYHAPMSAQQENQNMSPEQQQEGMKAWMTWANGAGSALTDLGAPLMNGEKIGQKASGPSDKDVAGYSIVQAENMNAAKALFKDHPHTKWHPEATIEIHEVMPIPGM